MVNFVYGVVPREMSLASSLEAEHQEQWLRLEGSGLGFEEGGPQIEGIL